MEHLIPLLFVLYMLGTVVSAIVQKRRGDAARRDAPPAARPSRPQGPAAPSSPVPERLEPDAEPPALEEKDAPAGRPAAPSWERPLSEEPRPPLGPPPWERPPIPDIFWPFPFEPEPEPAPPEPAPRPQEGLEREPQPAPQREPAAAPVAPRPSEERSAADERAAAPAPVSDPGPVRSEGAAASPTLRPAALHPGALHLDKSALGRAILLAELLGPPRAVRPYGPPAFCRFEPRPRSPHPARTGKKELF